MNRKIKMSIIVPTHGRVDLAAETLTSLEKQTSKNFEIIVTDDSNRSDEREAIKKLASNFNNTAIPVRYIFTQAGLGQPKNTNQGLSYASGEYIHILHSDDLMAPNCIETEIELLDRNADIDFAYHHFLPFYNSKFAILKKQMTNFFIADVKKNWLNCNIFFSCVVPSCLFFRKSLLERAGAMREDYQFLCDWDLFFKFLMDAFQNNKRFIYIPNRNFIAWRIHEDSTTGAMYWRHFFEHESFIKEVAQIYRENKIVSGRDLKRNIYMAAKYRFERIKKDIKRSRHFSDKVLYIWVCLTRRYKIIHLFAGILFLFIEIPSKILQVCAKHQHYKEKFEISFYK